MWVLTDDLGRTMTFDPETITATLRIPPVAGLAVAAAQSRARGSMGSSMPRSRATAIAFE